MAVIEQLSLGSLEHSKLKGLIKKAEVIGVPDPLFFQIFGHASGYSEALFDALHQSHVEGNIDHKLKEIIRVRLARHVGDQYFSNLRSQLALKKGLTEEIIEAGCGDFDNDQRFSSAEKWALRYSQLMYTEPELVDKKFYAEGKSYFSEAEIMELGSFIAFHFGLQTFMRTLRLFPKYDKDGEFSTPG